MKLTLHSRFCSAVIFFSLVNSETLIPFVLRLTSKPFLFVLFSFLFCLSKSREGTFQLNVTDKQILHIYQHNAKTLTFEYLRSFTFISLYTDSPFSYLCLLANSVTGESPILAYLTFSLLFFILTDEVSLNLILSSRTANSTYLFNILDILTSL